MINNIFYVKGKKNNQSSVSDADRDIPTLESTDNAGNSINLVSGIIRLPSGWDFSVCIGGRSGGAMVLGKASSAGASY